MVKMFLLFNLQSEGVLPWVPEGFFVLFCGDSERRSNEGVKKKHPLVTASTNLTFMITEFELGR